VRAEPAEAVPELESVPELELVVVVVVVPVVPEESPAQDEPVVSADGVVGVLVVVVPGSAVVDVVVGVVLEVPVSAL
jgi:hypothetical protein